MRFLILFDPYSFKLYPENPELLNHQWSETFDFEKSKILLPFHKTFGPIIVSFFLEEEKGKLQVL